MKYKMGQVNPDTGLVFWSFSRGKEMWYSPERFNERMLVRKKKYEENKKNPEWLKKQRDRIKNYCLTNSEYREKTKEYKKKYHEKMILIDPKYRSKNNNSAKDRNKHKYATDPLYALKCNMSSRIRDAVKGKYFSFYCKTKEVIGVELSFLMKFIEDQFKPGMNWGNRSEWHIDHFIPISLAKTKEDAKMLCAFNNLRPIWAKENLSKHAKIPKINEIIERDLWVESWLKLQTAQ